MANEMRDYLEDRERALEARVAKLTAQVTVLKTLAAQYRNDLLHPPASDSIRRRLQWIDKVMPEDESETV